VRIFNSKKERRFLTLDIGNWKMENHLLLPSTLLSKVVCVFSNAFQKARYLSLKQFYSLIFEIQQKMYIGVKNNKCCIDIIKETNNLCEYSI